MRENVYQHFKFTPKTTRTTVFLGVIVPAAIFGVSYLYDVSPPVLALDTAYMAEPVRLDSKDSWRVAPDQPTTRKGGNRVIMQYINLDIQSTKCV